MKTHNINNCQKTFTVSFLFHDAFSFRWYYKCHRALALSVKRLCAAIYCYLKWTFDIKVIRCWFKSMESNMKSCHLHIKEQYSFVYTHSFTIWALNFWLFYFCLDVMLLEGFLLVNQALVYYDELPCQRRNCLHVGAADYSKSYKTQVMPRKSPQIQASWRGAIEFQQ